MAASQSDALVLFGVTGDLAQKMIFPALYALVKREAMKVPVIGVASPKWSLAQLRDCVQGSITRSGGIDDRRVLDQLLSLLSYVSGDYKDQGTVSKIKEALGRARSPAHYLAIQPAHQVEQDAASLALKVVVEVASAGEEGVKVLRLGADVGGEGGGWLLLRARRRICHCIWRARPGGLVGPQSRGGASCLVS